MSKSCDTEDRSLSLIYSLIYSEPEQNLLINTSQCAIAQRCC